VRQYAASGQPPGWAPAAAPARNSTRETFRLTGGVLYAASAVGPVAAALGDGSAVGRAAAPGDALSVGPTTAGLLPRSSVGPTIRATEPAAPEQIFRRRSQPDGPDSGTRRPHAARRPHQSFWSCARQHQQVGVGRLVACHNSPMSFRPKALQRPMDGPALAPVSLTNLPSPDGEIGWPPAGRLRQGERSKSGRPSGELGATANRRQGRRAPAVSVC
jgi:hypothetical protein